jgi:peptide/nickel transport system substrate-binding protein
MMIRLSRRQLLLSSGGILLTAIAVACNSQAIEVPSASPSPAANAPASSTGPATATPAQSASASQATAAPQPTAAPQATVTPTLAPEPAYATVPRNETLIISVSDTVGQMTDAGVSNPFLNSQLRTGWHFLFEPFYFYNSQWTPTVNGPKGWPGKEGEIPYLATSYDYNADFTQIVVKLRDGVTWSDGQPFTTKDVVFTIKMLVDNAPKLAWSSDMKLWVKDIAAVDEHTVQFTLNTPNPRFFFTYFCWRGDFGFPIVPEHIFSGKDPLTFTNQDLTKNWPISTGPWRLVHSTPLEKFFDRRDDWWGVKTGFLALPKMKRVIVLPRYEDAKLSQLLIADQVDATHNLDPADGELVLAKNPKMLVRAPDRSKPWGWTSFWANHVGFDCAKPPFNDPDIRWALNYAMDRKQLVEVGFKNDTVPSVLPFAAFPGMQPFFDEAKDLLMEYPVETFDLNKTNQIMQQKGYAKDSGGFWAKDGNRFSFILYTFTGFFENFAPVIVAMWRKAGFDASYKAASNAGDLEVNGTADIWIDGYQGSYKDPYYGLEAFHSRHSAPLGQPADFGYRWNNKAFDTAIDEMAKLPTSDPKFHQLYRQAMTLWLKELPAFSTVQWTAICPVNGAHWKNWPDSTYPYTDPQMWQRGQAAVVINTLEPA